MTTEIKPTLSSDSLNNNGRPEKGNNTQLSANGEKPDSAVGTLPLEEASPGRAIGRGSQQDMTYRGVQYTSGGQGRYAPEKIVLSRRSRVPLLQWFYNLPVRNKQLIGLITSELISVLGLVGVGSLLIISGGRLQLLQQSKAELAVVGIEYDIKINQMKFGFRGQADNTAIVELAELHDNNFALSQRQKDEVREILKNEITARQIEYATLVGSDGEILVSANADRVGEAFDPEGLVSQVLRNPEQIVASAVVPWEEIAAEAPPLPDNFENEDALIRYTATPVMSRQSEEETVGVLISGDIVNGKLPITADTVNAFKSGYSAVYVQNLSGDWVLASSADRDPGEDELETFEAIYDVSLLDKALEAEGNVITQRVAEVEGEDAGLNYTMAAQAILDINGSPIGVLVRGTSEVQLNDLIRKSLWLQFLVASIALLADIILAQLLGRSIVNPLKRLQQATERFAQGDRRVRSDVFAQDEVGQLATAFNELANTVSRSESSLVAQSETQTKSAQRSRLLADLTSRIRQTLEVDQVLSTSVDGVREVLNVDRVVIYRFNSDFKSGVICAESVDLGWMRASGQTINDPLTPEAIQRFRSGQVSKVDNLETAGLTHCHCEILEHLEVKANMVAPILVGDDLIGLVCAHQCSRPRQWEQEELDLMQQLASQIGYALGQAMFIEQQQLTAQRDRQLAELVTHMRDTMDREKILRTAVQETRAAIATDRVLVFLFDESWQGTIVAESVGTSWPVAMGTQIADPCFAERYVEQYRQGRVQATNNVYEAGLTPCHINQLEPMQVKANLVAPILCGDQLIGLLIAHECSGPREWSDLDNDFMRQAATQLGFTLEQADLFNQREQARQEAETLSEERRQRQEMLQMQLLGLLEDVEGAAQGDLTVRADVSAGEIGTVADFFNSIVESLRQIVTQVKASATQVNMALGNNESAIQTLAQDALQQAEQTTQTLDSVEEMTLAITRVADHAQQAAQIAKSASETAEAGGTAMDLTVQNIMDLRQTVGETAKKVKRLGESSQQISKVVSLINQIAMQTNLLAINAGIEAARAGEEGQGFAAVAEEVGELAARSSAATQEIERIVDNIQRETTDVVEAIEQSTAQVVEGTYRVEDAKQSLTQIQEVSRQIDGLVQTISEATVSQVDIASTVSSLMRQIAAVSERTSASSAEVSDALRQTVSVAKELEASMATFKVEGRD